MKKMKVSTVGSAWLATLEDSAPLEEENHDVSDDDMSEA